VRRYLPVGPFSFTATTLTVRDGEDDICVRPGADAVIKAHEQDDLPYDAERLPDAPFRGVVLVTEGDATANPTCPDELTWIAVKQIKASRSHERVVVVDEGESEGDEVEVIDEDGNRQAIGKGTEPVSKGDELLVIKRRDDKGKEEIVDAAPKDNVEQRLDEQKERAQDDEEKRRIDDLIEQQLEEKLERSEELENQIREAGDDEAADALEQAREEASGDVKAKKDERHAKELRLPSDPEALACIERTMGRIPTVDDPPTDDDKARVDAACFLDDDGERGEFPTDPAILECIENALGRPVSDGSDLTEDEHRKIDEACGGPRPGDLGPGGDGPPPPEVIECIERVLGCSFSDGRDITPAEQTRIETECRDASGPPDGPPPDGNGPPPAEVAECIERVLGFMPGPDNPPSDDDLRRIDAECQSEPPTGDPNDGPGNGGGLPPLGSDINDCIIRVLGALPDTNNPPSDDDLRRIDAECKIEASPGDPGDGPPPDDQRGEPGEEFDRDEFCRDNPNDQKCNGEGPPPADQNDIAAHCRDNPDDPKCGDSPPPPGDPDATNLEDHCRDNPDDPKCGGAPPPDDRSMDDDGGGSK
jgi:hypothetical protein